MRYERVHASVPVVLIDPTGEGSGALAARLGMHGYAVSVLADVAEGARTSLADPPGAVIADLWMPSISGVQLCRLLKAEPATEHVPVILRGPDSPRNRFWAERAGASGYVVKGRMGDLVRALDAALAAATVADDFFTTFAHQDIRDRIATHLDAALFESVLAAEVRALATCGAFDRLFDLLSQFVSRVTTYRWLALATRAPVQLGLHSNPRGKPEAEREARQALSLVGEVTILHIEDDDAVHARAEHPPIVRPIELGGTRLGELAFSPASPDPAQDDDSVATIIARELAGPIRIATLVEESQRLATVDSLTGLMNRRAFVSTLSREVDRSKRHGHPLACLLLDIDHFKAINDGYGHATGDAVLAALGRALPGVTRSCDIVARWGGEEFVVALTSTGPEGAAIVAERLRSEIASLEVQAPDGSSITLTASIGVASFAFDDGYASLLDRADRAMYQAKHGGRDRVAVAAPASAPSSIRAAASVRSQEPS